MNRPKKPDDDLNVQIAVLGNDMAYVKEMVKQTNDMISANYVTKQEFDPVKRIVYGITAIVGTFVIGAIVGVALMR
jgi:hypothetical protein